jgi:hypothetical protein
MRYTWQYKGNYPCDHYLGHKEIYYFKFPVFINYYSYQNLTFVHFFCSVNKTVSNVALPQKLYASQEDNGQPGENLATPG